MKKLFIYGTMALMALTSCNDFLDKAPLDAFTNTPEMCIRDSSRNVTATYKH